MMKKLEISTLVPDPQLFCAWLDKQSKVPKLLKAEEEIDIDFNADADAIQSLKMVVTTHVDYFKGAATEEVADAFLDVLEGEFGKLTRKKRNFEHCGIIHTQTPSKVECTQDVKQLRLIPLEHPEV